VRKVQLHVVDGEGTLHKGLEGDLGGELEEGHGEVLAVHLPEDQVLERRDAVAAVKGDLVSRQIGHVKKREALDVVPVRMADEDVILARASGEFMQQRGAQLAHARPGVEDEDGVPAPHLDTGSVPAVFHEVFPRRGDGAAGAPEFHRDGMRIVSHESHRRPRTGAPILFPERGHERVALPGRLP